MKQNVIFLDIDGPMIPGRMYYTPDAQWDDVEKEFVYDPIAVKMVNQLCHELNAVVVMNSAHNDQSSERKMKFNGLKFFPTWGPLCTQFRTMGNHNKKTCVEHYVYEHQGNIERFVILDDENMDHPNQVLIDFNVGISIGNYFDAYSVLNGKPRSKIVAAIR